MARFKLYYPIDEITTNLYTPGMQLMTTDNKEYIGLYHTYTTGEIYTEPIWNPKKSVQLIPYREINDETQTNIAYRTLKNQFTKKTYKTPTSIPLRITKQDILNGSLTRYFLKKHNESTILEVNRVQYRQWQNDVIDSKLYSAVSLTWFISGNINDEYQNGIKVEGVITKNKKELQRVSLSMPELTSYLIDLTQYYTDNTFTIPTDINGLDS